jgi:hypothetical protein
MSKQLSVIAAVVALFAFSIAGCGGSSDDTSSSSPSGNTSDSSSTSELYSGHYCQQDRESSACLEEVHEKSVTGAPGSTERAESERELEREEMENQEGVYAPLTH